MIAAEPDPWPLRIFDEWITPTPPSRGRIWRGDLPASIIDAGVIGPNLTIDPLEFGLAELDEWAAVQQLAERHPPMPNVEILREQGPGTDRILIRVRRPSITTL